MNERGESETGKLETAAEGRAGGGAEGAGRGEMQGKVARLRSEYRERTPGSSRKLFSLSIVVMVLGVGLTVMSAWRAVPEAGPEGTTGPGAQPGAVVGAAPDLGVNSFAGGGGRTVAGADAGTAEAGQGGADWRTGWGPTAFRLGFSFFVAFAIAYVLRMFVGWAIALVGVVAGLTIFLQWLGLLHVNWGSVEGESGRALGWVQGQFTSFMAFAKGVLPSGAAAAAGLIAGWRRRG